MITEMAIGCGLVIGAALSLALRHGASVVAGLVLDARSGWRRETCPPHQ